ncbi:hypothetical protein WJX84_005834 [Apatococcus fuscideae]|uniref:Uncharacterized protein n=1 Tax=Apatococcus fuscideae TaxID=2026836 RepID=A0AAW1T8I9_9CHLO
MQLPQAEAAVRNTAGNYLDVDGWFYAASDWLEQEERRGLGSAMEASLVESEAEKAKQRPVADLNTEELLDRFEKSVVLPQMSRRCSSSLLMQTPLKKAVIDLLELERQSHQWYPCTGTTHFYAQLAEEVGQHMALQHSGAEAAASAPPCKKVRVEPSRHEDSAAATSAAAASASPAPDGASTAGRQQECGSSGTEHAASNAAHPEASAAGPAGGADELQQQPPGQPVLLSPHAAAALQSYLAAKVEELQTAIFTMPSRGGATPEIFADPAQSSDSDDAGCEIVSNDSPPPPPVDLL